MFKKGQKIKDQTGVTYAIVKVDPGMCDTELSIAPIGPDGSVGQEDHCNPRWLEEWIEDGAVTLVEEEADKPAP